MQRNIFSLFWRTAMRYPFRTLFALSGAAITNVIGGFVGPYIISIILEQLQSGSVTLNSASGLIVAYIVTQIYGQVIGWRLNLFVTWTMETAGQRDLYQQIFTALTRQSLSFHSDRFSGALVSQTTKLIGSFERFWDTLIFQLMPSIASIIGATIILSFIFWQYAVLLFALSIVFVVTVYFGSRFLAVRNKEEAQASTAANAYVADAVSNVMAIKSHGREEYELEELTKKQYLGEIKALPVCAAF
jgi:ATP-binding cassette subfamily B protein